MKLGTLAFWTGSRHLVILDFRAFNFLLVLGRTVSEASLKIYKVLFIRKSY